MCDELDEAPGDDKFEKFREKWDCISNTSSNLIKTKLKPRIAFTGEQDASLLPLRVHQLLTTGA